MVSAAPGCIAGCKRGCVRVTTGKELLDVCPGWFVIAIPRASIVVSSTVREEKRSLSGNGYFTSTAF
jgi:hypothetical protein